MTTVLYRWTVAILVTLIVLLGASVALQAALATDATHPATPNQMETGGVGRIMFS